LRFMSTTLVAAAVIGAFVAGRSTGSLAPQAAVAQTAQPAGTVIRDGTPPTDGRGLSHFKCYQTEIKLDKPATAALTDQFGTSKMQLVFADLFCAPVIKRPLDFKPLPVPGVTDHLLCYRGQSEPVKEVRMIANQLQRGKIQIMTPRYLCVPTWKQHITPKS
jgi:hypothetical protein